MFFMNFNTIFFWKNHQWTSLDKQNERYGVEFGRAEIMSKATNSIIDGQCCYTKWRSQEVEVEGANRKLPSPFLSPPHPLPSPSNS